MDHCYNASIVSLELLQENVDIKAGLLIQETHLNNVILLPKHEAFRSISIHKRNQALLPLLAVFLSLYLHHPSWPFLFLVLQTNPPR